MIDYNVLANKPFKFSITFKDTEVLRSINYYVNDIMEIDIFSHCLGITVNKINNEETLINNEKLFKSGECVICLTNPSNVLFCNCGHIDICTECDKVKSLKDCPMCKTETTIKRTIKNIKIYFSPPKKRENIL